MHITNNFIKIETSRIQGMNIEQIKCDQVKQMRYEHVELIKHEQSLRNDHNENLTSKWTSGHTSN